MQQKSSRRGREFKKPTDMRRRYHEDSLEGLSYPKLCKLGKVTTVQTHAGVTRVNIVVRNADGTTTPRTVKL